MQTIIVVDIDGTISDASEQELMEFVAIPISDGIKGMYIFGDSSDADNLKRLTKLANL